MRGGHSEGRGLGIASLDGRRGGGEERQERDGRELELHCDGIKRTVE